MFFKLYFSRNHEAVYFVLVSVPLTILMLVLAVLIVFLLPILMIFSSYRRVTGLIITHQRAALFTARRQEMIEVLERSFFYLLTHPVVHSPHSEIPFQVGWYFK